MNSLTTTRPAKSTQAVLEALQQLNHATAPDVMDWINRHSSAKKVSLTSVYRALNQLVTEALIKPLNFNDGQVRYELNNQHMHHHHLVCDACGKVEPFSDPGLEQALEAAAQRLDYGMRAHEVVLHGQCDDCHPAR